MGFIFLRFCPCHPCFQMYRLRLLTMLSFHHLFILCPMCSHGPLSFFLTAVFLKSLFTWLCQVLVVARIIFICSTWDLVLWPGIEPRPSVLGAWSLSHWTTRKVSWQCLLRWMSLRWMSWQSKAWFQAFILQSKSSKSCTYSQKSGDTFSSACVPYIPPSLSILSVVLCWVLCSHL